MVTKLANKLLSLAERLILAKIHMVTKRRRNGGINMGCLILAKIHMVTKLCSLPGTGFPCLILAKIHMVTKQRVLV